MSELVDQTREGGEDQYPQQQQPKQHVHHDDAHEGEHVSTHVAPVLEPVVTVVWTDAPGLVHKHVACDEESDGDEGERACEDERDEASTLVGSIHREAELVVLVDGREDVHDTHQYEPDGNEGADVAFVDIEGTDDDENYAEDGLQTNEPEDEGLWDGDSSCFGATSLDVIFCGPPAALALLTLLAFAHC